VDLATKIGVLLGSAEFDSLPGLRGVSGVLAVEIVGESRIEGLSPLMCSGVGIGISARAQLRGRGD
jgi:hypothetical protein